MRPLSNRNVYMLFCGVIGCYESAIQAVYTSRVDTTSLTEDRTSRICPTPLPLGPNDSQLLCTPYAY